MMIWIIFSLCASMVIWHFGIIAIAEHYAKKQARDQELRDWLTEHNGKVFETDWGWECTLPGDGTYDAGRSTISVISAIDHRYKKWRGPQEIDIS